MQISISCLRVSHPESRASVAIPTPECGRGTSHEEAFRLDRQAVRQIPGEVPVEVAGAGFLRLLA
jgi:hypothetical protein